jgi:hypothetical protein
MKMQVVGLRKAGTDYEDPGIRGPDAYQTHVRQRWIYSTNRPKYTGTAENVGLPPRRKVGGTPRGLNQSYVYNNINIILILETDPNVILITIGQEA